MIYAVIPTGNRPKEYNNVIEWCDAQGIEPITIATSSQAGLYARGCTIKDDTLNISRWWNLGIKMARSMKAEHIIVLNDDVELPSDWARLIVEALEGGYTGASGERPVGKITGYAFGLHGSSKVLADESLVWWYGDDDIQRKCEQEGGFAIIPALHVANLYANSSYYDRKEQIDKDTVYYTEKWSNQ